MSYISDLCKIASKKIHAPARLTTHMKNAKRRIIIEHFFKSKCSYRPFVWNSHSRDNHSKTNI